MRCGLLALFLVSLITPNAAADGRPRIGLVLGGGGARGAAHIGVLRVLEEQRVPVDFVVGTSMGAVVGGLYAAGYDAAELEATLAAIDWGWALQDGPPRVVHPMRRKTEDLDLTVRYSLGLRWGGIATPPGVLYGQHLELLLRRRLDRVRDVHDFDALPTPFRAVATDLGTGGAVVLARGDLVRSIRASMSVPGAFAPVRIDGRRLIDGGVVDNVPVDVARAMGADVVIAVDVGSEIPDPETLGSALAISLASTQILVSNRTREVLGRLTEDDVYVKVELGSLSGAAFGEAVTAIPRGEEAARVALESIRRHAVDVETYEAWRASRARPRTAEPSVVGVVIEAEPGTDAADIVRARLRQEIGEPLDVDQLEEDLDRLYGIGRFAVIDYELRPATGGVELVVSPLDKPWGPTLMRFGMGFADDFDGGRRYLMSVETLTHGLGRRGREIRFRLDVGDPTGARLEVYQPFDLRDRFFTRWRVGAQQSDLSVRDPQGREVGSVVVTDARLEGVLGWNPSTSFELVAGMQFGHAWASGASGFGLLIEDQDERVRIPLIELTHDTLDDFALPRRGRRTEVRVTIPTEALGAPDDNLLVQWQFDQAISSGRRRFLLGTSGASAAHSGLSFGQETLLGGLFRLSGYRRNEIFGDEHLLARLVYFDTTGGGVGSVFGAPLVLGASVEYGDAWLDGEPWRLEDLRWGGSVFAGFDTLLGSLYLGYGRAEQGRDAFYFSLGPLFHLGRGAGFVDF